MLSSDLDIEDEKDHTSLDSLLTTMLAELNMKRNDFGDVAERSAFHEVQLIIMRLLSVFMSRTKSGTKAASEVTMKVSHLFYQNTVHTSSPRSFSHCQS